MDIQTTIQVRIEEKIKSKAADILNDIGLDLSSGIKLFLNEVIASESIPFIPSTKKAKELRYYELYKNEIETVKNEGKKYVSGKDVVDDILKN